MAIPERDTIDAFNRIMKELGFRQEFSEAVLHYMNTEYLLKRMVGYLRNARPRIEEVVADEMLAIIEQRNKWMGKKWTERREYQKAPWELYVNGFTVDWETGPQDSYVWEIPAIRDLVEFDFRSNITFFTGENGTGKSTLLEALAVALGLNPEGGTGNYNFSTYDDYSDLNHVLKLRRGAALPLQKYFLRAESFYNVATAALTEYNYDHAMKDYHRRSHGESFLEFIQSGSEPGIYLMDEPEAALSPQRQLTLLIHLITMARKGAQFIIVTHSPILLAIPDAEIYSFDDDQLHRVDYEETESYQITKLFIENRDRMIAQLMRDQEDEEDEEDDEGEGEGEGEGTWPE